MNKLAFIAAATVVIGGCQLGSTVRDTSINEYVSLQGAQLVLHRALPVSAGKARVFIQDGEVRAGGFDSYRPHCALEIDSIQHEGVKIEPATFDVVRVQGSTVPIVQSEPVDYNGPLMVAGMDGDDLGDSMLYQGFHFWLNDPDHEGVRRMTCYGIYAEPADLRPPTLQDIQQTLGGVAELKT